MNKFTQEIGLFYDYAQSITSAMKIIDEKDVGAHLPVHP